MKQLRNWHSLNEQAFIEDFEKIKWKEILTLECLDPDLSFEAFITTINHLIEKHVPLKIIWKRKLTSKSWITNDIRKSVSQRDRLLKMVIKEKDLKKISFLTITRKLGIKLFAKFVRVKITFQTIFRKKYLKSKESRKESMTLCQRKLPNLSLKLPSRWPMW